METAQATSEPELGFPPKGSLKRFAFPRLMREVARNKLTGSLYLLHGQTKKVVFFEEGQPVFVRSNVLSECLGQILSSEGLITQEQCEQTLEAIRRTGKKQGELLVEMGILSEGNLRYGLEAQLRAKLYDIFSWEDGRYQFKSDPPNPGFGIRLEMCAEGVIIGAIQDQYSEERASVALQPYTDKFLVLRAGLEIETDELALLPEETYFVECLDGSRTVTACVTEPFEPPVPTPNSLVFGLLQAGVAQLGDAATESKPQSPAPSLSPPGPPDDDLKPPYEAQDAVTEYEDTPLPGELPKARGLLGDHEAGFDDVDEDERPSARRESARKGTEGEAGDTKDEPKEAKDDEKKDEPTGVSEDLVKAEPESVEETFDDDAIEIAEDDDDEIEVIEELEAVEVIDSEPLEGLGVEPVPESIEPMPLDDSERPQEPPMMDVIDAELPTVDEDGKPMSLGDDLSATFADPVQSGPIPGATQKPGSRTSGGVDPQMLDADDDLLLTDAGSDLGDDLDGLDLDPDAALDDLDAIDLDPDADIVEEGGGFSQPAAPPRAQPAHSGAPAADADELMSFDELDDVDLGDGEMVPGGGKPAAAASSDGDDNPEMVGAIRFNEAETALGTGDHARAVSLLEEAYENGFDVAELHAMLAYARFCASGEDLETAQHAFELLEYAQSMDPSLDLVHAYRGAIHKALGQKDQARDALGRALELNPYCELAMQLMDQLG